MGKVKRKYPKVKRVEVEAPEVRAFLKRVKDHSLLEEDYELIQAMAETIQCLSQALDDNAVSLKRLLRYLLGAPTETAKNLFPKNNSKDAQAPEPKEPAGEQKAKRKGHGRHGSASYTGGSHVKVPHPSLKPGDCCPGCPKGRVYELALPSTLVHITGGAPLQSTVYELSRLRCNLCGELFTAPTPEEAVNGKYDESAAAMIAILKYSCGMPFHRLEKLQEGFGMPVPASTQWEIIEAASTMLEPVHRALISVAAQGEVVHNDDTTAKVLAYLQEQDPESTRTGVFTTGVVSIKDDRRIGIFMTGRNHAGENLEELLKYRASGLSPPIQMCDALSRNVPKELKTILANCLSHARRQFVDIVDAFPEESRHVIELLAKVYHHDAMARERRLNPFERLAFHQEKSAPIMEELKSWCEKQFAQKLVEPNSGLGKAIQYLFNHWDKLTRFLHVPKVPLDNNLCERALKLAVRHRRNALFFKTPNGAHVGDVFMSLIHTCQLAGQNPFDYLTGLLRNARKAAQSPEQWFPWNYRESLNPS
jgi:transposase